MGHDGFHEDVAGIYEDLHRTAPGLVRGVGHRGERTAHEQYRQVLLDLARYGGAPGQLSPLSLLDVGAGYGHLYRYLRLNGYPVVNYIAIDTNVDAIGDYFLHDLKDLDEVVRRCMDVREITSAEPVVDIVACIGTLAWYDEPQAMAVAKKCWELCKKAAVFVIHEDTVEPLPHDIIDYLNVPTWTIDHSFDRYVTGLHLYKEP